MPSHAQTQATPFQTRVYPCSITWMIVGPAPALTWKRTVARCEASKTKAGAESLPRRVTGMYVASESILKPFMLAFRSDRSLELTNVSSKVRFVALPALNPVPVTLIGVPAITGEGGVTV